MLQNPKISYCNQTKKQTLSMIQLTKSLKMLPFDVQIALGALPKIIHIRLARRSQREHLPVH